MIFRNGTYPSKPASLPPKGLLFVERAVQRSDTVAAFVKTDMTAKVGVRDMGLYFQEQFVGQGAEEQCRHGRGHLCETSVERLEP